MGSRANELTAELERTRRALAEDLSELKVEASATARKGLVLAVMGVGLLVGLKILRRALRRRPE
jgi:hypothetical protein